MSKKLLLGLLIMLLAAPIFAGGSAEKEAMKELDDVDPSGQEVLYWFQHSRAREEAIQKLIAEFNATNEWGITVVGEFAGGYSDIYNKMITAIAGGNMPDLTVAYQNQAAGYQVADALTDLNPYVSHAKWGLGDAKSDYFEGFINQDVNAQFGGQRLGFPPNRSLQVLYYNKTWLGELGYSAPPITWDEFTEMCKAATESGPGRVGYDINTDASAVFGQVITFGGDIALPRGGGYKLNTPEMREALAVMRDLFQDGYAVKIAEPYGDQTDFGNYKTLFTIGSTSGLPYYERAVQGSDRPFEWSVAALPYATKEPVLDVYGASLSIPKSTPEKQLAAWLFVKWLTEPAQQAAWVVASNYFPVRKTTMNDLDSYFEKNPKYKDAFDLLMNVKTMAEPPYAGYDEVRDLMSAAYNEILDGGDIEKVLAAAEIEANEIYDFSSPE